jgi:uncharacterized MAPEG superfamily protein
VREERSPAKLGPYSFTLTPEDARTAASRAGLRAALAGRLSRHHVAPLAAFALFIAFVVIATFAGFVGRRFGEGALLLGAIAFMAARLTAHWRLRRAQKRSMAATRAWREIGEVAVSLDDAGLHMQSAGRARLFAFADCDEAEEVDGIIYLWRREDEPAFIPTQAFASEQAAQEFLALVREGIKDAAKRPV